ncbi:hypothetical protein Pmani_033957 [Petrolisthes manimaculis]|uniref:Uncharacterized protein n=1 Tax=Petrolisthes manimaculis TaxID=1843537 RepID=A0AAE1NQ20_9EUCA|nr:hypothetical protein Pmani_033957 [Petrolisthes manimaculis]
MVNEGGKGRTGDTREKVEEEEIVNEEGKGRTGDTREKVEEEEIVNEGGQHQPITNIRTITPSANTNQRLDNNTCQDQQTLPTPRQ